MPQQIPLESFGLDFREGKLHMTMNGQPFNMKLLQRVEVVIDAGLMQPFVRLTALAGDTGVKLGDTLLEIKPGEHGKPTFGNVADPGWPDDIAAKADAG